MNSEAEIRMMQLSQAKEDQQSSKPGRGKEGKEQILL